MLSGNKSSNKLQTDISFSIQVETSMKMHAHSTAPLNVWFCFPVGVEFNVIRPNDFGAINLVNINISSTACSASTLEKKRVGFNGLDILKVLYRRTAEFENPVMCRFTKRVK